MWEGIIHAAFKFPGVRRRGRIEQRHGVRRDIQQLDVFVQSVVLDAVQAWRIVHDFVDRYRTDPRIRIRRADPGSELANRGWIVGAERTRAHRRVINLSNAVGVAAE